MGSGEYLTDDGDGKFAVRKLAVDSISSGLDAADMPGWLLYDIQVSTNDCRRIYPTGNYMANGYVDLFLPETAVEESTLETLAENLKEDGWSILLQEYESPPEVSALQLKAFRIYGWIGAYIEKPTPKSPSTLVVSSSTTCVKPDGEVIDDSNSRVPDYFKDAS